MTKKEIILVVSSKTGKNVLFVLDDLQALTLPEAIKKTEKGEISGVHLVKGSSGLYLRASPNASQKDNLDSLVVSLSGVTKINMLENSAVFNKYRKRKEQVLKELENRGEKLIFVDGRPKETEKRVFSYLSQYKELILSAADGLKVDKYLLGAILIDEYLRLDRTDEWRDKLAVLGFCTSVGIAQVMIATARNLVRKGFYPADPSNKDISPGKIDKVSGEKLYRYLSDPKNSIYFVAAKINQIKKERFQEYDLSNLAVLAGLYSGSKPDDSGKPSSRGQQISGEFYKIAKNVLGK
ncbi:MAG: DUF3892 domain-containing protein [bacterium]